MPVILAILAAFILLGASHSNVFPAPDTQQVRVPSEYCLRQWDWVTDDEDGLGDRWTAHDRDQWVGVIDMRTFGERTDPVRTNPKGYGFFSYTGPVFGPDILGCWNSLDAPLTGIDKAAWETATRAKGFVSNTVRDIVFETFTTKADADEINGLKPLVPWTSAEFVLTMQGDGIIKRESFDIDDHPAAPQVVKRLQNDHAAIRADAIAGRVAADLHRRQLTVWMGVYQTPNWRQFIRPGQPVETPRPHQTTQSDNFNRSNEELNTGGAWTEFTSDFEVVTNEARIVTANGTQSAARFESAVSTARNAATVTITNLAQGATTNSNWAGPACRFESAAHTSYSMNVFYRSNAPTDGLILARTDAGSVTEIGTGSTGSLTWPIDAIARCGTAGDLTTIEGDWDSSNVYSVSDPTGHSTGTHGGFDRVRMKSGSTGDWKQDDFSVTDTAAAGGARRIIFISRAWDLWENIKRAA